jgi:histidinol-phosphate phosphatase family protein
MDRRSRLIVLDRDGVLNRTIHNPAEPRPDSPLRAAEVTVFPWVAAVLRRLNDAGFGLVIASNQPASAKGKATRAELELVHQLIVEGAQQAGAVILSSHICFHRAEVGCACRKPATGLLEEAFRQHPEFEVAASWMAGDRATDVLCGASFGLRTALLGPPDAGDTALLSNRQVQPSFQGRDLRDFADYLLRQP